MGERLLQCPGIDPVANIHAAGDLVEVAADMAKFAEEPREFAALDRRSAHLAWRRCAQEHLTGVTARGEARTIGGLIDRLEAKGLVQRSVGEHDRRTKLLTLTRAGSALLKEVSPKVRSIQSRLLAPLSAGERKEFLAMLERIVDLEEEIDDA